MKKGRKIALTAVILVVSFLFFMNFINAQNNNETNYTVEVEQDVINALQNSQWVTVSITLNSLGSRELNLQLQSEIISNFSEEEFRLTWESSRGRGFQGRITKEGMDKLRDNPNVIRVYLPIQGSTTENGTIYIAEVEQDVINALQNSQWVTVIVKVQEINYILVDSVLAGLSPFEFRFQEKSLRGDGFVGNITQEGLDKLVNNPNVRSVYLNRIAHILYSEVKVETIQRECKEDSDCIIASLTCCGCQVSSFDTPIENLLTAINKKSLDQWEKEFGKRCSGVACIQGMNLEQVERCNLYTSKCTNNICRLVDNKIFVDNNNLDINEAGLKDFKWLWIIIGVFLTMIFLWIMIKRKKLLMIKGANK